MRNDWMELTPECKLHSFTLDLFYIAFLTNIRARPTIEQIEVPALCHRN